MDISYGRIMLLGTAGVGKTSLKRSLMKLPWNPCTNSTIVSDVSLVWHTMDDDKWREVTEEDERDELAQLLAIVYRDSSGSFLQAVAASTLFPIPAMINVASVSEIKVKEIERNSVESVITDAIERAKRITVPSDLKSVQSKPFLHIWDCGGQPVFLEILPAFLTPRTMFLLLFDASKNFNERWQSVQTVDGQRIFEEEANETTLGLMSNWSSTIHGHLVSYDQKSHALPDYPRLYYIGTRGDGLLSKKEHKLTERHYNELMKKRKAKVKERLDKQMEGKAYLEIVPGVFIVDNTTSGRDKEDPDISNLRKAIINFVQQKLIVKTPVTWVLFRKILLMLKEGNAGKNEVKKVIDIEEAHAVGAACKIPHDDVPKALLFYHEVGAVLFYPHVSGLHNKVIIDPKWFVDTLGKVFTLEGREEDQTKLMISLLREKGILVQPFYAYIWKSIKEYLNPESMMELLVYFRLAAEVHTSQYHIPDVKQYFLPAVLKSYCGDPGTVISNYQQRATPLHITFKTGFVPPGYFTRLVTTLASKSSFKLEFKYGIYRNRVTFLYGTPPDLLTLTNICYAIQVDVLQCAPDMASFNGVCLELKAVLKESSDAVEKTLAAHRGILSPGLSPLKATGEFQFICNGCVGGDHYINEYGSFVDCKKKLNAYRQHTKQESFWFERNVTKSSTPSTQISSVFGQSYLPIDPTTGATAVPSHGKTEGDTDFDTSTKVPSHDKTEGDTDFDTSTKAILLKIPKTKDAVNHLVSIGHKWREIGIALEVTHSRLEEIKEESFNTTRLSNVMSCWKDESADDATWGELIEAIEGPIVNSRLTAKNMREFLKNPETQRKYGCL